MNTSVVILPSLIVLSGCMAGFEKAQISDEVVTPVVTPALTVISDVATGSAALNVPEQFVFTDYQEVTLTIAALKQTGAPIVRAGISVYQVPSTLTHWSDEHFASAELIAKGITDSEGNWSITLELPNSTEQVLFSLNYIGIDNKALVQIDNNNATALFN